MTRKKMVAVIMVFAVLILVAGLVKAAGNLTPAGTTIVNNATATYEDPNGTPQPPVDSGPVQTTVGQVYSVAVDPNNTGTVLPGGSIAFVHTVTNAGNGDDSFALTTGITGSDPAHPPTITLYQDTNGNGVVDPGEPQINNTGTLTAGQTLQIIVIASFPPGYDITDPLLTTPEITVRGTSDQWSALPLPRPVQPAPFAGTESDTAVDNITVRTGPILQITKDANVTTASPGSYINFTIRFSNIGNSIANGVVIHDNLNPGGLAFGDLPYVYSQSTANTDITVISIDGVPAVPAQIQVVGTSNYEFNIVNVPTFTSIPTSLPINATHTITYRVRLKATIPSNANNLAYNVASLSYTGQTDAVSNVTQVRITPPAAFTADPGGDKTVNPGDTVFYPFRITNTGGVADTYTITPTTTLPATNPLNFSFYHDVNGNGIYDPLVDQPIIPVGGLLQTPVLGPGEVYDVIMVANVPTNPNLLPTGRDGNNNPLDTLTVNVSSPVAPVGNPNPEILTFRTHVNKTPGVQIEADRTVNTNAGSTITMLHTITNTGTDTETFTATLASQNGWTYTLWYDLNNNGVLDTGDTQIVPGLLGVYTIPPSVIAGGTCNVFAQVQVPNGTSPGTTDYLDISVTAVTLGGIAIPLANQPSDANRDRVNVVSGPAIVLGKIAAPVSIIRTGLTLPPALWAGYPAPTAIVSYIAKPRPGECVLYAIPFVNNGPVAARNVLVSDLIPANTTYVAGSATVVANPFAGALPTIPNPPSFSNGRITLTIPTVNSGEGGVLLFYVEVNNGQP